MPPCCASLARSSLRRSAEQAWAALVVYLTRQRMGTTRESVSFLSLRHAAMWRIGAGASALRSRCGLSGGMTGCEQCSLAVVEADCTENPAAWMAANTRCLCGDNVNMDMVYVD